ncbi:hypothetical protein [Pedobacter psychrodurus]|uniref:hypothetical protein n=1 Tax=Pedobacter psychrodurus TaxID=2530456 RepID=UPI0029311795|nr:hypothetical protein [Pedobacter psychrodurus]
MKKLSLASLLLIGALSGKAQTYQAVASKNKTYLETVKGLSYTYKNGMVTIKNNGKYDLGTVSIIASSKTDSTLFGIALFEEGLKKGQTDRASVYFTASNGRESREIPLAVIDQKSLVFSFDKAVRAGH